MTSTVTSAKISAACDSVTRQLKGDLSVERHSRNGYTAIELYDAHGLVRTLTTGTRPQAYAYVLAMIDTLELVGRDASI